MANTCLKTTFCTVSAVCVIASLALVGGGIWYSMKLQEVTSLRNPESVQLNFNVYWPQVMPMVFIGVGILSVLVACCGFCGGAGSKGCLMTYNVCAFFVIIAMVGSGIAAIMFASQKSDDFISTTLHNVFQEVLTHPYAREKFSAIESSLHCCGADGPRDYYARELPLPASCCDGGTKCSSGMNLRRGCIKVISTYTKWAFYTGTAGCALIVILAIVSMCLSIALIRRMGSKVIS